MGARPAHWRPARLPVRQRRGRQTARAAAGRRQYANSRGQGEDGAGYESTGCRFWGERQNLGGAGESASKKGVAGHKELPARNSCGWVMGCVSRVQGEAAAAAAAPPVNVGVQVVCIGRRRAAGATAAGRRKLRGRAFVRCAAGRPASIVAGGCLEAQALVAPEGQQALRLLRGRLSVRAVGKASQALDLGRQLRLLPLDLVLLVVRRAGPARVEQAAQLKQQAGGAGTAGRFRPCASRV